MKVAIVCDWLTGIGGAERVVLELHKLYPEAPIYTSQYDPSKIDWFKDADVRTTWLQKLPTSLKKFFPALRALTFSHLNLREYDLVISCSGAEAKGIKTRKDAVHINYCFAPTHYYWSRYDQYMEHPGFGKFDWLARLGLKALVGPLRRWDKKAAQRPDYMIGISTHIQQEIKKYYGRDATLIHPPVDTKRFMATKEQPRQGFVVAGRQTPYKRFDLAIQACTKLKLPLIVAGKGPDNTRLRSLAGSTVTFKMEVADTEMPLIFQSAEAFIFPGLDDFGITPVEAMAAGTPVIAYKAGGALDYVEPGVSGEFFTEVTTESLVAALKEFRSHTYKQKAIIAKSQEFSSAVFRDKFTGYVTEVLNSTRG
jgi:glycosyltransferase involved in cell wall biosynthesis